MFGWNKMPVLLGVIGVTVVGCGGPPRPRITELETVSATASSLSIARLDVVYDGGQIQRVYLAVDGVTQQWARVGYGDDGRVRSVEQLDAEDEETATTTFGYDDDGRLVLMRRTSLSGDSVTREVDYDGGQVTKVTHRLGTFDPVTEETDVATWTETWRYDDRDRPERILTEGLGEPIIMDLAWDDDGGLLDGTKTTISGVESSNAFSYEDGRLTGVSAQGGGRAELTYDADRLEAIASTAGGTNTTLRYFYDDGDVDGIVPRPLVSDGFFFDLAGHILDEHGSLPLSSLLE